MNDTLDVAWYHHRMIFDDDRRGGYGGSEQRGASRRMAPAGRPIAPLASDETGLPVGRILFGLLLCLTALVQATFLPAVGLLQIIPDFALVFLLIWSATHGTREGLFWAFALGLWIDLLTLEYLGTHAIALLVVALIGGVAKDRLFRAGVILPMAAVFAATLAYNVVAQFMALFASQALDSSGALRLAVMTSLLNTMLVPVAYFALLLIERLMPRRAR